MTKLPFALKAAALLLAVILTASTFAGCTDAETHTSGTGGSQTATDATGDVSLPENGENDVVAFRPAESGMPARDTYKFPYIGLQMTLTAALRTQMDSYDVLLWTDEAYNDDRTVKYALLSWYKLTEQQKNETLTAFDPTAWLAGLEKIGTLGVYHKAVLGELDALSGCTEHKELGTSADGNYGYYLSFADGADEALRSELDKTVVVLDEILPINPSQGGTAFSEGRVDAQNVGDFKTTDIGGKEYGKDVFGDYELTLVNVFATWCSPCVQELPELEKLRAQMAEKGVGVVGIVYDAIDPFSGDVDEYAYAAAQQLQEKLGLTFPLLLPDETQMGGRLQGILSFPESFFVDQNGNIVGETYQGARSLAEWTEIVEEELARLHGEG